MSNPLLEQHELPLFSRIAPEHVEPAIDTLLAESRTRLAELLAANSEYTWDNLIRPIEDLDDRLARAWSPVSHLNAVMNSDALRDAYNACLPKLSAYHTERGQNEQLFQAYQAIAESDQYQTLNRAQRRIIDNALRDFRLSGIDLDADKKARYKEIMQELSKLSSKFQDNLLDATQAWKKQVTDESLLSGLPDSAKSLARQNAERENLDGWLLNLEFPCYFPVMSYADNQELRREMYTAYSTRASDQGPYAGQWDNTEIMAQILSLRHELAQLLGFADYTEYSLATKMAQSPQQVMDFLNDLAIRAKPQAQRELEEIKAFAKEECGADDLQVWDIQYYAEKLRQHRYQISQEELRPYFPENRVIPGLFAVAEKLYGIQIKAAAHMQTWHEDVKPFEIVDSDGSVRARFYFDLYARANKRGGAWMDGCVNRRVTRDGLQIPAAYMICNFTPPPGRRSGIVYPRRSADFIS